MPPHDQKVLASAPVRLEQVDGIADLQLVAFTELLMHEGGAAARILDMQHADLIGCAIMRRRHQRIGVAAHMAAIVHQNDDVGAAGEMGHRLAVKALETEALDALGDRRDPRHADRNFSATAQRNNSSGSGALPGSSASILTPWKAASRRE